MPKPTTYYDPNLLTLSEIAWLRQNQKEASLYYQEQLRKEDEAQAAANRAKTTAPKPEPRAVGYLDLADSTETALLRAAKMVEAERKAAANRAKTPAPKMTEAADQSQPSGIQIPVSKADQSEES